MSINLAVADTTITHLKPRISVIGVGGGGGNAVNNMIAKKLEGVDFVVANTDSQALAHSSASRKIQLGLEITQGLGAGARPEIGKLAAEEAQKEIEKELEGANMVFITAGMGGGTGSGAAPVVAKIAKEKGILTVGVVTKPFEFEGKKRMQTAENALEEFTNEVDSIIVIPNQNLFRVADKSTTLSEAFVMADNVLYSGVRSITDLMMMPGLINLDFADIKSIMEDKGKAIMGTGEAEGENRAKIAAEQALSNPLLDDCSMKGAKGVLINITGGNDITLMEIAEAADIIKEEVDDDANIIFGSSYDNSLEGKIRVSIVVTGIENRGKVKIPPRKPIINSYIDESYAPATENEMPIIDENSDIEGNLERFSATKPEEDIEENIVTDETTVDYTADEPSEDIISFDDTETTELTSFTEDITPTTDFLENIEEDKTSFSKFEDFDMLEKSNSIPEAPQGTALFNAIINKQPAKEENIELKVEKDLDSFMVDDNDVFTSKTVINTIEEEPVLFPDNEEHIFMQKPEDKEEIVEEPVKKPSLRDRLWGISITRKNRKEQYETQEPISPKLTDDSDDISFTNDDDMDNLDFPAFLRKK